MRPWLVVALSIPAAASGQSRADEIRLARSAAPAAITAHARIYVLDHGHYVIAEPGTAGVACMVIHSTAKSIEPECGDAEADATVLAVDRFRTEQRLAGKSRESIERTITDGLAAGRFRAPKRPALVWMMSSGQLLADSDGTSVGQWMPHLMVFYPGLRDRDLGLVASSDMNMPLLDRPDTPLSSLIVVAASWVDPAPTR